MAWPASPFSAKNRAVALAWMENPVSAEPGDFVVIKTALARWNQAKMQLSPDERRGLSSLPKIDGQTHPRWVWGAQARNAAVLKTPEHRAAREKVPADLAQIIGLPVPPVQIWKKPAADHEGASYLAVSLKAFDLCAEPAMQEALRDAFFGPMTVFDVWIGNSDRRPRNITKDISDEAATKAYFDHEKAFTSNLEHTVNRRWHMAFDHDALRPEIWTDATKETVDKIRAVPDKTIRSVVERLPDETFDMPKAHMIHYLVRRRDILPFLLK